MRLQRQLNAQTQWDETPGFTTRTAFIFFCKKKSHMPFTVFKWGHHIWCASLVLCPCWIGGCSLKIKLPGSKNNTWQKLGHHQRASEIAKQLREWEKNGKEDDDSCLSNCSKMKFLWNMYLTYTWKKTTSCRVKKIWEGSSEPAKPHLVMLHKQQQKNHSY